MRKIHLILQSLRYYRRTHFGVVLGAALAATVLVGALTVGDSVRYSLTQLTMSRLGGTEFVLMLPDRFFPAGLAERMQSGPNERVAPVLILNGVALTPEGDRRINAVQVVGVDDAFWDLAPKQTPFPRLGHRECRVNQAFVDRLGPMAAGDAFVLRLQKPGGLPANMTLSSRAADGFASRLQIAAVLGPEAFGHFTLQTTQSPPPTIFLPLSWLGAQLEIDGLVNVLLIRTGTVTHGGGDAESLDDLNHRLEAYWQLEDAGLRVAALPQGGVELQSDRVFIDDAVAAAAQRVSEQVQPVITYFVNAITAGDRSTPYSFVTAPGPPRMPASLESESVDPAEIRRSENGAAPLPRSPPVIINDWLAEDLAVGVGDSVTLTYYAVDSGSRLEESSASFQVAGIVPVDEVAIQDRGLPPDIPGLSDVDNCQDWDPGIPIELDRIRDRDEAYWDAYGPLPKVYLTQSVAERLWRNRFGTFTALRFPASALPLDGTGPSASEPEAVAEAIRRNLSARELGFVFRSVKQDGLAASRDAVDFGHLFAGLSFFLIVAALLLTCMLFTFSIRQRNAETGTLRALGFQPGVVRHLMIAEGLLLVSLGGVLGGFLAFGYNALMLRALQTLWHDAVRTSAFQLHARPVSVVGGVLLSVLTAVIGMTLAIRGQTRRTIRELQHRDVETPREGAGRGSLLGGLCCLAVAVGLAVVVPPGRGKAAMGVFFASGGLLLAGLLALAHAVMGFVQRTAAGSIPNDWSLAIRGATLRRERSLACMVLMSLGVFLVMAVAANRRGESRDAGDPAGGTGGYRIWGQSTLPLLLDLNSVRGRSRFGLTPEITDGVTFLQLPLREGDDASCLNLNRVTRPHLLGVDPGIFDLRQAFGFVRLAEGVDAEHPWRALKQDLGPDIVPAFADQADITWGLGLSIGESLTYRDEQGHDFEVILMGGLAPSIFQGHLLVDARQIERRFPSLGGTRVLLADLQPDRVEPVLRGLTEALSDVGLECVSTRRRLAEFNSVENTYLAIFMLLGGLGVLVGSAGMGIVAARNILERRSELALLRAVGFRRRRIRRLLAIEHGLLAVTGVAIGGLSALVAVIPALLSPETTLPWSGLGLTLAVILIGSLCWIKAAVYTALHGDLLPALRQE